MRDLVADESAHRPDHRHGRRSHRAKHSTARREIVPAGDMQHAVEWARENAKSRRDGAALAGVRELRSVPQLRASRRALRGTGERAMSRKLTYDTWLFGAAMLHRRGRAGHDLQRVGDDRHAALRRDESVLLHDAAVPLARRRRRGDAHADARRYLGCPAGSSACIYGGMALVALGADRRALPVADQRHASLDLAAVVSDLQPSEFAKPVDDSLPRVVSRAARRAHQRADHDAAAARLRPRALRRPDPPRPRLRHGATTARARRRGDDLRGRHRRGATIALLVARASSPRLATSRSAPRIGATGCSRFSIPRRIRSARASRRCSR